MTEEKRKTYEWMIRGTVKARSLKEAKAFVNIVHADLKKRYTGRFWV